MDFNRIGELIKKTKDKLIVATDTELLVVMDLDSYEELIKENQSKEQFVVKDELKVPAAVDITATDVKESIEADIVEDAPVIPFEDKMRASGPISVKDVIANKAEDTFTPPTGEFKQVDEVDEFYFEEVEE